MLPKKTDLGLIHDTASRKKYECRAFCSLATCEVRISSLVASSAEREKAKKTGSPGTGAVKTKATARLLMGGRNKGRWRVMRSIVPSRTLWCVWAWGLVVARKFG
jgi:hypothetical protein